VAAQIPEFAGRFRGAQGGDAADGRPGASMPHLDCLGPDEFVKDVFLDSDTDIMVLSFVPSTPDAEPVTIEAADADAASSTAGGHAPPAAARPGQSEPGRAISSAWTS
jgi:hypothetical protein